ncbi:DUF6881 domain-containing protein [Gottfriedia solisilvae]|uniref:DUF6881 domain-containing protein n=1 Tax=Gottfriedia solisilvae TaxID=1516104 RepID=UPI003D2F27C2
MNYIYVEWNHPFESEPFIIISEIDDKQYEIRKIEIFKNGSIGFADSNVEYLGTELSAEPFPSIDEIKSESEFIPKKISKEQFEEYWLEKVIPLLKVK